MISKRSIIEWVRRTNLSLGANVEESPVSGNEMVCLASSLIGDVNLTLEDVLGFLVVVLAVSCRSGNNSVETGCQVRSGVSALRLDGVEVGDDGALSLGNGDVLVASALDDGERNDLVVRH